MGKIAYVSCPMSISERVLCEHVQFLKDTNYYDQVLYWDRIGSYNNTQLMAADDVFYVYAKPAGEKMPNGCYQEAKTAFRLGKSQFILYKRQTDDTYQVYHGFVQPLGVQSRYNHVATVSFASTAVTEGVFAKSRSSEITQPVYQRERNPEKENIWKTSPEVSQVTTPVNSGIDRAELKKLLISVS